MKTLAIVNITTDSFFKESRHININDTIKHINKLIKDGADIIDIGAQASNPDAKIVSLSEEWNRLKPIINYLKENKIKISVDSYNYPTQIECINANVDYINDIHGFSNKKIYPLLSNSNCKLIIMHSVQKRKLADKQNISPLKIIGKIYSFFDERINDLLQAGISSDRIIIDPGMGFFLSSNYETSIEVLKSIKEIKKRYKLPLLICVSRKSFLRNLIKGSINESLIATIITELYCYQQGVSYIRTHDVKYILQAIKIWGELSNTLM